MKIQDRIKSDNFAFWISVGAVLVQTLHTTYILTNLSSLGRIAQFHSFAISILISGSILYFTIKGKTKIAIWAAILESYFNICYYVLFIYSSELSWNYLFIAIPSSLALPTVLALFSHELTETKKIETLEQIQEVEKHLLTHIADLKNRIYELEVTDILKNKNIKLGIQTSEGYKQFDGKVL